MPRLKNSRSTRSSILEIYKLYPFKKSNLGNKPRCHLRPYFPVEEETNCELSIDFKEWKKIILRYYELVEEALIEGETFNPPFGVGSFKLRKRKGVGKRGYKIYQNIHTNGFLVNIFWHKKGYIDQKLAGNIRFYNCRPLDTFKEKIYKAMMKNSNLIYRYNDTLNLY